MKSSSHLKCGLDATVQYNTIKPNVIKGAKSEHTVEATGEEIVDSLKCKIKCQSTRQSRAGQR